MCRFIVCQQMHMVIVKVLETKIDSGGYNYNSYTECMILKISL